MYISVAIWLKSPSLKLAVPFSGLSLLFGAPCPPKWIDDEPKVSKPTLVATMAGLLLHAVAGMPASGSCNSHSAAVPLLSPSTPRTPLTPSLFALSLSCSLCTSLVFSEDGQFVETLVAATFWVAALSRSLRRTCSLSWGSSSRCELGALDVIVLMSLAEVGLLPLE